MKVVLDTNVIVAAFAARGLCADLYELCIAEHRVILSKPMLEEVSRNLARKVKLPPTLAANIVHYLQSEAEIVEPAKVRENACRDKSDLMVLGTAEAGKADAIVTGDKDLLILHKFRTTPILSPRDFWSLQRKP